MSVRFRPANQPNYLDNKRFTLQEYREELSKPVSHPDTEDPKD